MALNNDIIPGRLFIAGMPPSVRVSSNLFAQEHTHNDCKQSDPTRRTNDYINETAFCHPLRSLDFPGRGRRLWKRRPLIVRYACPASGCQANPYDCPER